MVIEGEERGRERRRGSGRVGESVGEVEWCRREEWTGKGYIVVIGSVKWTSTCSQCLCGTCFAVSLCSSGP